MFKIEVGHYMSGEVERVILRLDGVVLDVTPADPSTGFTVEAYTEDSTRKVERVDWSLGRHGGAGVVSTFRLDGGA